MIENIVAYNTETESSSSFVVVHGGQVSYFAIWDRALSKKECEQLHKDPYALLIFSKPTSWLRMMFDRLYWRVSDWFNRDRASDIEED